MMRDHHPYEILIDVSVRSDRHLSCMRAFTVAISE